MTELVADPLESRDEGLAAGRDAEDARELVGDDDHADPRHEARDDRQRQEVGEPTELEQPDEHDDESGDDGRRGDEFHVLAARTPARDAATPRRRAARSSSPRRPRRWGWTRLTKKTSVAVMKAIIAVKAGTPASCDVASCSGIAIASSVMPARNCAGKLARVSPRKIWLRPLATLTLSNRCAFA